VSERSPLLLHRASPVELKARLEAERSGDPYLVYRDDAEAQIIVALAGDRRELTVGRRPDCDVALGWDNGVSRLHAQIERIGQEWALVDDGLSQNGSYVNDTRVVGRRRLEHGDVLRFGATPIAFCAPPQPDLASTVAASEVLGAARIPPAQRRVLVELCRPLLASPPARMPATNREIAAALYLSVDAVKTHLRALGKSFGVDELPQNEKRIELAERALRIGAVTSRDAVG
jgi:hypothetical protein